ncbi:MAG: SIMPL domain-containing protein [Acidobacteria bacterium]|nr:SIMPL domain-containing protein [Acidobacteriota bacterium]
MKASPSNRRWLVAVLLAALAGVAAAEEITQPVIVTTGEAIVHVPPDRAHVNITAQSRARSPREAQQRNAEAMAAVQRKLKDARIPPDAIRTLTYDLQPEFDYQNGRQTLRDYLATNTIEVRVDEIERVGDVIDLSIGSGATSVSGIRFDLKNRDAVERDALRQAVADARARADAAAAGAGQTVQRVLRIEEQRLEHRPPPRPMMMAARADVAAVETPIAAGELEVRAQVTLTAELGKR